MDTPGPGHAVHGDDRIPRWGSGQRQFLARGMGPDNLRTTVENVDRPGGSLEFSGRKSTKFLGGAPLAIPAAGK
jgi:hypothetical protein